MRDSAFFLEIIPPLNYIAPVNRWTRYLMFQEETVMKSRLLVILPLAFCLVLAACHARPSHRLVQALNKAGLEKAPTLGEAFRRFVVDYETKNYKHMYARFSRDSQDELMRRLDADIAAKEAAIAYHKAQLHDTHHNVSASFHKRQLKTTKRELHRLKDFSPSQYLAYLDHPHRSPSNIATKVAAGKLVVAGEQISGLHGVLLLADDKGNPAGTLLFVGEVPHAKPASMVGYSARWKLDFFRTTESPAPPPPSTPNDSPHLAPSP